MSIDDDFKGLREAAERNKFRRFKFYIRQTEEEYNGETRRKYAVTRASQILWREDNASIIDLLSKYKGKVECYNLF
jgi:hypothetical protein